MVENVIGAGLIKYGGTGRNYFNLNGLLIGNGNDGLNVTSNLYWDNQNEKLIFSNNSSFAVGILLVTIISSVLRRFNL